jgi:stringent starvation protein B
MTQSQLPPMFSQLGTSTRPYLIRALHDWCTDNGFTPYLAVYVDETVKVPFEHVKNNEIVLNVSFDATHSLELSNEAVQFKARFGGIAREIYIPVDHVIAIYSRENGQGMAFPAPNPSEIEKVVNKTSDSDTVERKQIVPLRLATIEAGEVETVVSKTNPTPHDAHPPSGSSCQSLKRIK